MEGGPTGGCGGRAGRQESLVSRASDGSYLWYVCEWCMHACEKCACEGVRIEVKERCVNTLCT